MRLAEPNTTKKKRSALMNSRILELPDIHGTGWTNYSWADRFKTEVPTRESIPPLYLPHYHEAGVTSQTRVLLRHGDVIHYVHRISRAQEAVQVAFVIVLIALPPGGPPKESSNYI